MQRQTLYLIINLLFTLASQAQPSRGPGKAIPPSAVTPAGQSGKYVALLIGVSQYDDPLIEDLKYPQEDVIELANILVDYHFKRSDIIILTNPKEQVFFDTFSRLTSTLDSDDNLLIYFSGHGELVRERNYYWLAADARRSSREGWISVPLALEALGEVDCKHILLIIDSCHGGAVFKQIPASKNGAVADALRASSEVIQHYGGLKSGEAITSGTPQEVVPDKSHFFDALQNCLKTNPYKYTLSSGLFNCLREYAISTQNSATFKGIKITPQRSKINNYLEDQGGEFIFYKPTGANVAETRRIAPKTARQTVEVGKGIQELTVQARPGQTTTIHASGSLLAGPNVGTVTPTGITRYLIFPISHYNLEPSLPHGALLYRLAPEKSWRYCGDSCTFQIPASGEATVQLTVNDNHQADNHGAFIVEVQTQ